MTGSLDEASTGFLQDAPFSTATNFYLLLGDNAYGYNSSTSDLDSYALHLDVGSNYTIIANHVTPFGPGFATFGLYNRFGTQIASPTNYGTYWGYSFTATDTLYFVSTASPTGAGYYTLRAQNNSITESNGIGETIAPGGFYSAALDYTSDSDHFLFTGFAGRTYRIDVNTTVPNLFLNVTNLNSYQGVTFTAGANGAYFFTAPTLAAYELTISSNSFTSTGSYSFATAIYPSLDTTDFNGDDRNDVLWQNDSGQAGLWQMNGLTLLGGGLIGSNPGPSWHIEGSGRFNADDKADILWQNDSGQAAIWLLNGTNLIAGGPVGGNPGPTWHIKSAGDFNGDGKSDILWQDDSGQAAIWLMNGTDLLAGGPVGGNPGPSWHVVGAADFNGDNQSDILWQNDSGQVAVWLMNGMNFGAGGPVNGNPGPSWHAKGTGDFDGDGKSDILWQDDSGQAAIWLMNGALLSAGGTVGANPGSTWHVSASIDINDDARSDIVWQSDSGQAAVWAMSGTNLIGSSYLGTNLGPSWHIISTRT